MTKPCYVHYALRITSILLTAFLLLCGTAQAQTLLEVDFDSMTVGDTTKTALDAATTGGSWSTNTAANAAISIEDDDSANSDLALWAHEIGVANQYGALT